MKGYDPSTGLGFIQNGRYVEVVLPYDRKGGEGVQVGAGLFGVCAIDGVSGDVINIDTEGAYGLVAASGASTNADPGAVAYWDNTNKRITPIASTHLRVGVFLTAKTTSQAFASVLLD
jgi:predicted RecA/RadA family phage recombinase